MNKDNGGKNKLFQEAKNEMAYLKCGILGFAGSGKTFTASLIAIGLSEYIKADKPIFFLDTETGSDFVLPLFQAKKVELKVCKSRAFVDLLSAVDEAEKTASVLIIDSITHFWNELLETFMKDKGIKRITLKHWMPLKQEWRQFTDKYINSKLHIIMCGRAGWEFDYETDDEGAKELVKTGTKMKAETEMGYEPSLLLEMERVRLETGKIGASSTHRCWVLKDRFDRINGKFFDNPNLMDFIPHIELLNLGGQHKAVEDRSSAGLFESDKSVSENLRKRDIYLEELKNEIVLQYPGQSAEDKKTKLELLQSIFGTNSWTAIEGMSMERVKEGLDKIRLSKKGVK